MYEYCSNSRLKLPDILSRRAEARRLALTTLIVRFTDFLVHKSLFTKGFRLAAAEIALRWRDSRNSQRGPCASGTQLDSLKAWCPRRWTKPNNAMRIEVMRGHTKSLDANDKLIQTRSHEQDTAASRKRHVVMRKVKSTIKAMLKLHIHILGLNMI